jgi:hypothetical protein
MLSTLFDTLVAFIVNIGGASVWMVILVFVMIFIGLFLTIAFLGDFFVERNYLETLRSLSLAVIFLVPVSTLGFAMLQASTKLRDEADAV